MRGSADLIRAKFAFEYFDRFTAWFPIRLKILPSTDGMWVADMLVSSRLVSKMRHS